MSVLCKSNAYLSVIRIARETQLLMVAFGMRESSTTINDEFNDWFSVLTPTARASLPITILCVLRFKQ